ncbi:MAG TPA: TatD family hydrolase [Longimicrobiales bacterium]|nr:TatD family hydrolase [Longimicrobiales bacterium]
MELFDAHCHLTNERFAGEGEEGDAPDGAPPASGATLADGVAAVVARARNAGVTAFVTIASHEEDATAALRIAERFGCWSSAGIHPHAAERFDAGFARVRELLEEPRVVAVGETGLDYYYDNAPRAAQRRSFEAHLEVAGERDLPVVVHAREADDDVIAMIRSAQGEVTGVLHCFAGGVPLFDAAVEAGWYISFSGLITFRSYGTPELAAATPADRLLVETDSPFLAPVPHRGRRNEPAFVVEVARRVAELRGETLEGVAELTTRNARTFYNLLEDHA